MAGMTLIELLVTLAIAAILLTIGIPSFQEAAATNRVAGLTNELTAAFNLARSEAITRGQTVTVCRSADTDTPIDNDADPTEGPICATDAGTGWNDGWLVFVDLDTDGTVDANEIRLKVGQPGAGAPVIDGGGDATDSTDGNFDLYLSYFASGVSRGNGGLANGTLHLCSPPGKRRDIILSNTGRIRIEKQPDAACP
jgi:type IV fimbrial biogenesis protein FimT